MTGYTGGLYDGIDIPKTRAEARREAETMLNVLRDDARALVELADLDARSEADKVKERVENHLTELYLYMTIMSDARRA